MSRSFLWVKFLTRWLEKITLLKASPLQGYTFIVVLEELRTLFPELCLEKKQDFNSPTEKWYVIHIAQIMTAKFSEMATVALVK